MLCCFNVIKINCSESEFANACFAVHRNAIMGPNALTDCAASFPYNGLISMKKYINVRNYLNKYHNLIIIIISKLSL